MQTLTTADHIELLRSSEKFYHWRKRKPHRKPVGKPKNTILRGLSKGSDDRHELKRIVLMVERHYEPTELAALWGVSTETIRSIFREEPGVLKIGSEGTKHKRGYITLRIPETVVERVHRRLSA